MNKEEFLDKLEALGKPYVSSDEHRYNLKLTLVNAQKSSRIGYLLVILPCLFLFGVVLKYALGFNWGIIQSVENMLSSFSRSSILRWLTPIILVAGPLVGIAINLLAILHFSLDRELQEVQITLRLRWANLIVIFICVIIVAIFGLYIVSLGMQGASF
jgi:hypothetical protein